MPNLVYTPILNIYDLLITYLNEPKLIFFTELNGVTYCNVIETIQN